VKHVVWLGESLACVREFPQEARQEAGVQLGLVQAGAEPSDWKPMPAVGLGVNEIRVRVGGAFRVSAAQVQVACPGPEAAMAEKLKSVRGSGNVFLDLGFPKVEAENLKMRADLMIRIVRFHQKSGMTQAAAAKTLGLTQPRLNALLKGKIGQFSLDALVVIATRAGLNVRLVVKKAA